MGLNSPMPSSMRDECRKASKIVRSFVDTHNNGLDKVIPRYVLERAAGFAIFTVAKAGFLFSARAGSGLVIARLDDGSWSPPSGIAVGGVGFGGQAGAEVTDFLIVLNSRAAVANFMSAGSVTLGGNMSVAVGPMGRNAEGSGAVNAKGQLAAMYSYSKTKGLFGGVSLEGTVIAERQDANRLAYGGNPTAKQILTGAFEPPEWAYVLIDVLDRATGLPGGQTWVEDAPERMGAMGWSSPTGSRTGAGYAFGEGVGAGGSKANRKRSSSLFSIGANSNKGRDDSSVFSKTPQTPSPSHTGTGYFNTSGYESRALEDRAPPPRPWEARRASSLIPFSKSMNFASFAKDKDRKMGPSSETYNSAADYSEQRERERRRSSVVRPYKEKPTPSPFVSELDPSRSNTPRSSPPRSFGTRSPVHSNSDSSDRNLSSDRNHSGERERDRFADLLGPDDWDNQRTSSYGRQKVNSDRDLIGTWEADPHGLTANFSKLSTSDYTNGHSNGYSNGHSNGTGNGFSNGLSPRSTPNRTPNRSRATSRADCNSGPRSTEEAPVQAWDQVEHDGLQPLFTSLEPRAGSAGTDEPLVNDAPSRSYPHFLGLPVAICSCD